MAASLTPERSRSQTMARASLSSNCVPRFPLAPNTQLRQSPAPASAVSKRPVFRSNPARLRIGISAAHPPCRSPIFRWDRTCNTRRALKPTESPKCGPESGPSARAPGAPDGCACPLFSSCSRGASMICAPVKMRRMTTAAPGLAGSSRAAILRAPFRASGSRYWDDGPGCASGACYVRERFSLCAVLPCAREPCLPTRGQS